MVNRQFHSFEQLYRAAFGEIDPERKRVLLGEVCKAIEQWERSLGNCTTDEPGLGRPASSCLREGGSLDSGQAACKFPSAIQTGP